MKSEENQQWEEMGAEILSGMKEWASQHPKATFAEIERETMRRMAQLQARIMEKITQKMADEQEKETEAGLSCAECGGEMQH
jgi:hypothetical protein